MAKYHRTSRPGWAAGGHQPDQRHRVRVVVLIFAVVKFSRGCLAGRGAVPGAVAGADAAEPAVPRGGALAGPGHLGAAGPGRGAALRAAHRAGARRSPRPGRAARAALCGQPAPTEIRAVHFGDRQRGRGELQARVARARAGRPVSARGGGVPGPAPGAQVASSRRHRDRGPRRGHGAAAPPNVPRLSQRLLHDRTADRIAEAVGRIPHVAATIVPFDTTLPHEASSGSRRGRSRPPPPPALADPRAEPAAGPRRRRHAPICAVPWKQRVTVEGRVKLVQPGTSAGRSLEVQVFDETGGMRLLFFGRTRIPGLEPGAPCAPRAGG